MTIDIPTGFVPVGASSGSENFESLVGPLYQRQDAPANIAIWGFRAERRHCNPFGIVHGGMLTTFADTMMGSLVFHAIAGAPCATITLTMDFVGAGREGDWIEGRAELLRQGRSICFLRSELRSNDKIILNASGAWAIIGSR